MTFRPESDAGFLHYELGSFSSSDMSSGMLAALFSGGDSRITPDPRSGLNKYLCPVAPVPGHVYLSSCTASPASTRGFDRAAEAFSDIIAAPSSHRAERLAGLADIIEARLLQYFGVGHLAKVILCPSGTDAMLTATRLIASERPDAQVTAILPSASETGTGVPMAAAGRAFSGADSGAPLIACAGHTVEVSLRFTNGSPRSEDEVNQGFAEAAKAAAGHAIVTLTHGTKTGLIAPTSPPPGADVIVDACQARIEPTAVATYLRSGWPVVITGSKFYGGPAFSGAVLFPRARMRALMRRTLPDAATLGTILRWTSALAEIDAFACSVANIARILTDLTAAIELGLASNSALVPIGGLLPRGCGWADLASIFTFAVHDPMDRTRLLSVTELQPVHQRLAALGVLLGQPVGLGSFGGLRIAIGARDLLAQDEIGMDQVFAALAAATALPRRFGNNTA